LQQQQQQQQQQQLEQQLNNLWVKELPLELMENDPHLFTAIYVIFVYRTLILFLT
jgi:hypothetical protein